MKFGKTEASATLAVAVVLTYSLGVGWYWTGDAIVLAILTALVTWRIIPKMASPTTGPLQVRRFEQYPRSKISHYVSVSRIKSTASIAKRSDNPFERTLLSDPRWRGLSDDDLRRKVLESTGHDGRES